MKWLAGVLVSLSLTAHASGASASVALVVRETRTLQMMGVTAAWSVDPSIATASAITGGLIITAHATGRTRVVVVSVTGQNSLEVTVEAPVNAARTQRGKADHALADVRYSSATGEIHNDLTVTRQDKNRRTEANVHTVHQSSGERTDRPRTSVAAASYRVFTRGRELTLLDRDVDHSPLTVSGTAIRGVHYLDDHWSVHAGYTAYATWRSVLLPLERERVFGAAYAFGDRNRFTPGIFTYPGKGTVVSLLYDHQPSDQELLRAEIGLSRAIGGALLYKRDSAQDRVLADIRYRPTGFPMVGPGDLHGLVGDASWSHLYGRGSSFALAASETDLDGVGQRVLAASADLDQRVSERLTVTAGASWGSFGDTHSFTMPAGLRLDFSRGSAGALYRYAEAGTNAGGHGGRIFGRTSIGRFYASGYADRQQNAPTLEVIFSERPDLEIALRELGIQATTPGDIARALRENASLIELGFIEGITVDLAPVRTQFGLEVAWLAPTVSRDQLRARLTRNVIEGVASRNETTIATLMYSRRLTEATDIFASYSYWQTRRRGEDPRVQPYFELGLRQRFDGLPSLGGGGTIAGIVFADEDLDGKSDGAGVVAEVDLDGSKTQVTGSDGTFVFRNVPRGTHRVSARVANADAYFTTPSRVEAEPGDKLGFGVASTPAHVSGSLKTDAGDGIAGVRIVLTRGSRQVIATTDTEGHFASALPPGEWQLAVATDSVPPGYSLNGLDGRTLRLERGKPQKTGWTLHALRSLTVTGASPDTEFRIDPIGRTIRSDARGAFSLRSLPPGEVTLTAGSLHRTIEVPRGPASLTIGLGDGIPPRAREEVRTLVSGETSDTLRPFVVNIGAFRVRANAEETLDQARQAGVDARLATQGKLTVVRAFFASRLHAIAAADRLRRAGLEAVITSTK